LRGELLTREFFSTAVNFQQSLLLFSGERDLYTPRLQCDETPFRAGRRSDILIFPLMENAVNRTAIENHYVVTIL
jgi:hypothetical protein